LFAYNKKGRQRTGALRWRPGGLGDACFALVP
jgi:hypothetical protein